MTSDPRLESILRWSLSQADGTAPARQISEEERQWFKEALESQVVDVVKRMKEISAVMAVGETQLEAQGVTVTDLAGVLEELQEHVESIDMANDLKAVGGLEPLLQFLKSPHALLRARAAEVVSTMVQNNPKSQENVMLAGGLIPLCDMLMTDDDLLARTKALGAISSLVRHNAEGLSSFRTICGVRQLLRALSSGDSKLCRKSLHLLKYLLEQYPADSSECTKPEVIGELTSMLSSAEGDIRMSGAEVLIDLSATMKDSSPEKVALLERVGERLRGMASLTGEEAQEVADEKQLLQTLQGALTAQLPVQPQPLGQDALKLLGPPR